MPVQHFTKWFAVEDAKMALVTADAAGGATTYATAIDVPGIKAVKLTGNVEVKALRGDNQLLDKDSVLLDLQIAVEHAKVHLDLLPAFGFTVADSGTTPNQIATASLVGGAPQRPKPFKFSAKTPTGGVDLIGGDGAMIFYKCVASQFPEMGFAEEDYQTVSFEAESMPCLGTGFKWLDILVRETQAALT
jgi:hypothetical protein